MNREEEIRREISELNLATSIAARFGMMEKAAALSEKTRALQATLAPVKTEVECLVKGGIR